MFLGTVITAASWLGPHEIQVTFATSHSGHHQLYVGRRLAGQTTYVTERTIRAQVEPSVTPSPLQVLAVEATEVATDFGTSLPDRPYNLHTINWDATGIEADTSRFLITRATAIDTDPTIFDGAKPYVSGITDYSYDTPPIEASGNWRFGITPYDTACGDDHDTRGNAGTQALATVVAEVYPPDVALQSDRQRFNTTASEGNLTVSFEYLT
jgi:hypothetical protein